MQGQVSVDVGVQVKGGVRGGSLGVCEELVSHVGGGRRRGVEAAGGQGGSGAKSGRAGVLVTHVALTDVLHWFYLKVNHTQSTVISLGGVSNEQELLKLTVNHFLGLFFEGDIRRFSKH